MRIVHKGQGCLATEDRRTHVGIVEERYAAEIVRAVNAYDEAARREYTPAPCARCKVRPELYYYDDGPEPEGLCAVCVVREPMERLIRVASDLSERIAHAQRAHNYGDELSDPCWLPASADEWAACIRDWWDGVNGATFPIRYSDAAERPLRTGWRGESYGVIDE